MSVVVRPSGAPPKYVAKNPKLVVGQTSDDDLQRPLKRVNHGDSAPPPDDPLGVDSLTKAFEFFRDTYLPAHQELIAEDLRETMKLQYEKLSKEKKIPMPGYGEQLRRVMKLRGVPNEKAPDGFELLLKNAESLYLLCKYPEKRGIWTRCDLFNMAVEALRVDVANLMLRDPTFLVADVENLPEIEWQPHFAAHLQPALFECLNNMSNTNSGLVALAIQLMQKFNVSAPASTMSDGVLRAIEVISPEQLTMFLNRGANPEHQDNGMIRVLVQSTNIDNDLTHEKLRILLSSRANPPHDAWAFLLAIYNGLETAFIDFGFQFRDFVTLVNKETKDVYVVAFKRALTTNYFVDVSATDLEQVFESAAANRTCCGFLRAMLHDGRANPSKAFDIVDAVYNSYSNPTRNEYAGVHAEMVWMLIVDGRAHLTPQNIDNIMGIIDRFSVFVQLGRA
jgi:hypothetical protein